MMKNRVRFSVLALTLLGIVSCTKSDNVDVDGGVISLSTVAEPALNVESNEEEYSIATPSDYRVLITQGDGNKVWETESLNAAGNIELLKGSYKIALSSGSDKPTFSAPAYSGSADFTITRGRTTKVSLTTKLSCAVVDVNYSDKITANFADYRTTIWVEGAQNSALVFDATKVDSLGYFPVSTSTLHYKIEVTTKQGFQYSKSDKVIGLVGGDLLKLNFDTEIKPDDTTEPLVLDLLLSRELNEVTSEFEFGATLESTSVPTITGRLIDLTKPIGVKYKEGSEVKIDLGSKGKMSRLLFMFRPGQTIAGFGATIDIMALDTTQRQALGVTFESGGSIDSEVSLMDISGMTKLMPGSDNGAHNFYLAIGVLDKNGQYAAREVVFNVYGVSVTTLPDVLNNNIDWLGAFGAQNMVNATIHGRYNLDSEPDGMIFMYRIKGAATWSTVTDFVVDVATKVVKATLSVPAGGQTWEYKMATDNENGDTYTFTTPFYPTYNNLSLDNWGGGTRENPSNWGSPNYDGVLGYGVVNSTSRQAGRTGTGYAARIVSGDAAGQFASGGLFTGAMDVNMKEPYKSAQVGKEFSGRPKKLVGYFKYKAVNIHRLGSEGLPGNGAVSGQPDMCEIAIKLEKWNGGNYSVRWRDGFFGNPGSAYLDKSGVACDGRKAQVQDYDGNGSGPADVREQISVGYGKHTSRGQADWTRFEINIEYYQNIMPDRLIITAVSSAWGGYMSGAEGSELWVDDLEFVY